MKVFAKLAAAVLAIAAPIHLAHAQGPTGNLRSSEPPAIVAAAQSCRDAVGPERLDEQRLTAEGWAVARLSQNGQSVESPLRMFARNSIMLMATPGSPGCVVMARLRSTADYAALLQALSAAFGRPIRSESNGRTAWLIEGDRAVQTEPSGSRDRPAVRIMIIYSGRSVQ